MNDPMNHSRTARLAKQNCVVLELSLTALSLVFVSPSCCQAEPNPLSKSLNSRLSGLLSFVSPSLGGSTALKQQTYPAKGCKHFDATDKFFLSERNQQLILEGNKLELEQLKKKPSVSS